MAIAHRNTAQWQALDASHHIHPFCDPKSLAERGVRVITGADGCYVTDSDNNRILDGMAGLWCVNVGYGRQELVDVAAQQMEQLPFYNSFFQSATPSQIELAQKLSEIAPGNLNHFFFANSGSEANDTVIRMARHYWHVRGRPEKYKFIGRNLGYHGSTLAATSLGGMKHMHDMGSSTLPGFEHIMEPHWYAHGGNMTPEEFGVRAAQALEDKILEVGADNIAAFIGEPIQGAGGVKIPPASYWPEIQRICDKYDVLLMLDEVITGYGRTGAWFAAQSMGIKPDTMTTAKGLTSGYQPLSALLVGDRIAATLVEKGGEFYHGYTYSGHPVACAVALRNLEIIEREGLIDRVRDETGPYLGEALKAGVGDHPLVGEIRTFGMLAAIEVVKDKATRERFQPGGTATEVIRDHAIASGLMMRAVGDTMIMSPPLIWTKETIDMAVERVRKALDLASKDLL